MDDRDVTVTPPPTWTRMMPRLEAFAPRQIKALRVDPDRGYPVPWFVPWVDGKPEFRAFDPERLVKAVRENLCWVCGEKVGNPLTFVIGPMCSINRISSEPPSHHECAVFSVKACPFLSKPHMVRRDAGLPEECREGAGVMLKHNPGVTLLWTTRGFQLVRAPGGVLFEIGEPFKVSWWTEGREATRAECEAAINRGYPILVEEARKDGDEAVKELYLMRAAAERFLPAV